MITSNPIIGTGLHAIGGISASSCYLPNTQTEKWPWGTFWLAQALFAWVIMPLVVGWLTVPGFFQILIDAHAKPFWLAFFLLRTGARQNGEFSVCQLDTPHFDADLLQLHRWDAYERVEKC